MKKESTLRTGKLSPGGLPRNNKVMIMDRPDMTSAFYFGRKATHQTNTIWECNDYRAAALCLCVLHNEKTII